MNFFGIGIVELVAIMVVALLVLGPNRMVEASRTLGKYLRELQRASTELPRLMSLDEEPPKTAAVKRQQVPEETNSEDSQPEDQEQKPKTEA
jgi:sec-independent protein translocase protein TatA